MKRRPLQGYLISLVKLNEYNQVDIVYILMILPHDSDRYSSAKRCKINIKLTFQL